MHDTDELVRNHYEAAIADPDALVARVALALDGLGGPPTAEQLGNFDQFHAGGLNATIELARRTGITPGLRILDAGSGLGGPSRYLAQDFDCHVVGVDLAPAYVRIAQLLADRAGLTSRVEYQTGSITDLPFEDGSFDLVWTQHVVMNVPDRDALYREIRRVLRRGGRFAFYDPYLPDHGEPLLYPTPWAQSAESSTLLTQGATTNALQGAGLPLVFWNDVTEIAKGWLAGQQQQIQRAAAGGPGGNSLSPAMVVGARMQPMVANFAQNLAQGRVRLGMGLCTAG